MSSFSGSNSTSPLSNPASETLQLYSVVLGDELEIEGEGGESLRITSKILKDGITEKHTRYLNLKREAVLLYYTIATNVDVTKLWNVGVVYGSGSTQKTEEYPLYSEQDAFKFQRLVTGYTPHRRFKAVTAYALEKHYLTPWKRATEITFTGEVQLWDSAQPKPQNTQVLPLQATRDGYSAGGKTRSIASLPSNLSGASILSDDKSRAVTVTRAKAPPLLVQFTESEMSNSKELYQMIRVDITNLQYRDSPTNPKRLKLITNSKREFEIYTLATQQVGSWNLCHLRPGVYSKHFKRHKCDELTLDFEDEHDVLHFKEGITRLRCFALSVSLDIPPDSRGTSTSGAALPEAHSVVDESSLLNQNPRLDDDGIAEIMQEQSTRLRDILSPPTSDQPRVTTSFTDEASDDELYSQKVDDEERHTVDELNHQGFSGIASRTLKSAIASGELEHVKTVLDHQFDAAAQGNFEWLSEFRDHGYSTNEIAQFLVDEETDSPWILLEPRTLPRKPIIPNHHQPFCVHTGGKGSEQDANVVPGASSIERDDQMSSTSKDESYIQELCGLAGIVPSNRDLSSWLGSVRFEEEDNVLTASASFQACLLHRSKLTTGSKSTPQVAVPHNTRPETEKTCRKALENLCYGIGLAQRKGLCCDSFTFLYLDSKGPDHKAVELHRVEIAALIELRSNLTLYTEDVLQSQNLQSIMMADLTRLKMILPKTMLFNFTSDGPMDVVHLTSLAIQLLCLAFSSYLKAHIGPLRPFFVDTPVHTIRLFGSHDFESRGPHLTASLCKFTCLHNMLQSPVLVFGESGKAGDVLGSYDVLACPEDLVDTWGPGQFVTSSIEGEAVMGKLTAIMIGGGVIKPTSSTTERKKILHWSNEVDPRHDSPVRFTPTEKIIVSGVVEVNKTCRSKIDERWASFIASLVNLGTTSSYWQFTEFQAGLALVGQQFAGGQLQFNKTWTWHPGNSWKRQFLGLLSEELPFRELDRPWGLQVSACTGVARRVPLRVLLADVMPAFAESLAMPSKDWVILQSGIIQALQNGTDNLKQWYDQLDDLPNGQELQTLARRLIMYILLVLRDTGIDREQKIFRIACPQDHTTGGPITMCLPVPCERANLWAQILTDTEYCATFACMTTLCLESQEHKCQRTTPWHCPSLHTAVQQIRSHKEPILVPPKAWSLEINTMYWIGSPESGLQAKVVKPANSTALRLQISKSRIPQKMRARLRAMSRKMDRLRERQIDTWPAEDVLVLSQ
ncbi:hypothetical protein BKA65DRAFT_165419 [Rhexocercosporidium sp. MPI-PUGE-AT-0058]|nr:hypothetical protein BKA65DRAFT_165419 [Rhexocercosporidium sp. MPI-PUGE-AT-0058]